MLLIKTANHIDGQLLFYLPAGAYRGLFIRFAGTNAAGQTLAVTELGQIRLRNDADTIIDTRPSNFVSLTNLYYGTPESASAIGAAYTFSFFVPFRYKTDDVNVLGVKRVDQTQLALTGFNTAKVSSGTIEVYAVYSNGVEKYIPLWREQNESFAGAATKQVQIVDPFVEGVYMVDSANLSRLTVLRDGAAVVDGSWDAIDASSDAFNRVETGIDFVEVLAPQSPYPSGVRQTALTITATGAISEQVILYNALKALPDAE